MKNKYGCVLLAGGSGRRMGGRNKAELEYERQTFAEIIAKQLESTGMKCYLSAAAYEQSLPEDWKLVKDSVISPDGRTAGPMGGICSCLVKAEKDGLEGLFFAPCDAPFYTADAISKLAGHIEETDDAVCWRTRDGRLQSTFGWYSVRCISIMEESVGKNKNKIRRLLDDISTRILDTSEFNIDDRLFSNINTIEEYRELRNMTQDPGAANRQSDKQNRLVSLEEAVSLLTDLTEPIDETEEVSLMDACGRTLAEDVTALQDQPPFPRSPLDGYAVIAADTGGACADKPAVLKVIAEVDAGHQFTGAVKPGEAVRIMTGAPVPDGADAVVGQEDTDYGEDSVRIYAEMKPHQNYCFQGEEYKKGDVLVADREHIGPVEAGIIASTGRASVSVYRKPRVLLVTTGDEVIWPGEELGAGKIYDSNMFAIASQLVEWGTCITETLHSGDDPENLIRIIEDKAEEADIIITTGGVSVGKKDILHDVFRMMDIDRTFWKVAVKPGMAMLSGRYRNKHILALSGNPFAAYVDLHMIVRPVINALNGNDYLNVHRERAVLMDDYSKKSPSRRFVRAYVEDGRAYIEGHTGGNGDIYSGHRTNALIEIPAGTGRLMAGDMVDAVLV